MHMFWKKVAVTCFCNGLLVFVEGEECTMFWNKVASPMASCATIRRGVILKSKGLGFVMLSRCPAFQQKKKKNRRKGVPPSVIYRSWVHYLGKYVSIIHRWSQLQPFFLFVFYIDNMTVHNRKATLVCSSHCAKALVAAATKMFQIQFRRQCHW